MQEDSNHETSQIIVDTSVNTVYHIKLRVRGIEGGRYTCTVNNNIQDFVSDSTATAFNSFEVQGITKLVKLLSLLFITVLHTFTVAETPTQLTAVYKSNASILLAWTHASNTLITTGYSYVVYYEHAECNGRCNMSVSSGDNTYLLTGPSIRTVHSIFIVAVSLHLPSNVVGPVDPGMCSLILLNHIIMMINSDAVVEPPEVQLTGSGSGVVGTSYTLTCTVTLPSGVQLDDSVPPDIQWLGPNMTGYTPTGPSQISSSVYVSNITLNPLQETHSGRYSCSVSYCLGGISSDEVTDVILLIVENTAITVISEFSYLIFACL